MLSKISWYWNRARCMSRGEIRHRLMQLALYRGAKYGLLGAADSVTLDDRRIDGVPPCIAPCDVDAESCINEALRIMAGYISIFSSPELNVGTTPNWNRDPSSGVVAPLVFGPDLAITDKMVVGEIKYLWEFNRHLHLVRIAQAFVLTNDCRYLDGLADQIESWLDQCPAYVGPNWNSSLELGVRLVNWFLIWRLIGGRTSQMFRERPALLGRWLTSIEAHCRFIARHLSAFSSANNHLIGEVTGLFVATTTWLSTPEADKWADLAHTVLEREAKLQFSVDGVNREQATSYQIFSSEFLVVAGMQGECCGRTFSNDFWAVLSRSVVFLRTISSVGGKFPMFGDADDGAVWHLETAGSDQARSLQEILRVACGQQLASDATDSAKWFRAIFRDSVTERPVPSGRLHRFPEGGYFLFGANFGLENEVKGVVDCGPLGYLGIAAHGHADALSLVLSVAGEECLVDPGTYSYWQELKWRDYFRGTSAHNTLRVDGLDQSVQGGRFMWTRKAESSVLEQPDMHDPFVFRGRHDGYSRLDDPMIHTRSIQYASSTNKLVVVDAIAGTSEHLFEQFWHVAPSVAVTVVSKSKLRLSGRCFIVDMEIDDHLAVVDVLRASADPVAGWYSSAYEQLEPCYTIRIFRHASSLNLQTSFTILMPSIPESNTCGVTI